MSRTGALRPLECSSHPSRPSPSTEALPGAVSVAALPPRTFLTHPQRPASLATFSPPERASTAVEDASTPGLAATAARQRPGRPTSSYQRLRDIHSEGCPPQGWLARPLGLATLGTQVAGIVIDES